MSTENARGEAVLKKLVQQAIAPKVQSTRRIVEYYQLLVQIRGHGDNYFADGDWERAYVMYLRWANLALKELPNHNAYGTKQNERWKFQSLRLATVILQRNKQCRKHVLDRYAGRAVPEAQPLDAPSWATASGDRRPTTAQPVVEDSGEPAPPPPSAGATACAPPALPPAPAPAPRPSDSPFAALHAELGSGRKTSTPGAAPTAPTSGGSSGGAYPSVQWSRGGGSGGGAGSSSGSSKSVGLPTGYGGGGSGGDARFAAASRRMLAAPQPAVATRSFVNEAGQAFQVRHAPGLRPLLLSPDVMDKFLAVAAPNTNRGRDGIETLGVLVGTMRKGTIAVTHIVVPPQIGERDNCSMSDAGEMALLDFCSEHGLLTLGWIHTHPCQACFMSSVDVHTHAGYQTMLPEAIAIVLAPRERRLQMGVFRLSTPAGLAEVQGCTKRGFHPHREGVELYNLAPHVSTDPRVALTVVDLR